MAEEGRYSSLMMSRSKLLLRLGIFSSSVSRDTGSVSKQQLPFKDDTHGS
jgi:hypothetical protein